MKDNRILWLVVLVFSIAIVSADLNVEYNVTVAPTHFLPEDNVAHLESHEGKSSLFPTKEEIRFSKDLRIRKVVYEYDADELYQLLLSHGVHIILCEHFRKAGMNGETLLKWSECESEDELKALIEKRFDGAITLSKEQVRHLFAIQKRYDNHPYSSRTKLMYDRVHGQINIHPLLVKIIETPQFQRLRYLKQLGTRYYVYPSATHTRFEHCIGTSHLASLLMQHLRENQPSLNITSGDDLCVRIAALCHDLGHGPFSHLFEHVIHRLNVKTWAHEKATIKIFERMLSENKELKSEFEAYNLFDAEIQLIKDLIHSDVFKSSSDSENAAQLSYKEKLMKLKSVQEKGIEKSFLFEIVSNYRNGIDVDKFDYLDRDSIHLGFRNNFDYKRYIGSTRVIRTDEEINQICVRDKEIGELYELFHVREYLTRHFLKAETVSSIDLMFIDALEPANSYFNFTKMIEEQDFAKYETLTDEYLFWQILLSNEPALAESKRILERIVRRKLYKHVGSLLLPSEIDKNLDTLKQELGEFIVAHSKGAFPKETFVVEIVRLNYGSSDQNPLENVRFYNRYSIDHAFKIEKKQLSQMLLNVFEDVMIRVYIKPENLCTVDSIYKVYQLFYKWAKSNNLPVPLYGISVS